MLQMKLCGDLILREKCTPVSDITPEICAQLNEMEKMMEIRHGVGLAAPQVGLNGRFLIMKCKMGNDKEPQIYKIINPIITEKSDEQVIMEEGCLSVLGGDDLPVYADVSRPKSVNVNWIDETGEKHIKTLSGYPARIIQHETDHLNGVLFIDYLAPVKREMIMQKVRKHKVKA
jgi:peptide deformylase